ncbi:MFS general substrate transporter [Marasmius fiardii PR-910]|nr:MFS general substrate transporter [Marasmius fiardii PR-910]
MANERTPLLSDENRSTSEPTLPTQGEVEAGSQARNQSSDNLPKNPSEAHNIIYERFSRSEKVVIVSIVSYVGLIPLFVSGSFFPSIPDIVKDLHTKPEIVNLAVSIAVFAAALGAFIGASFSTFYGRRPIYLCGLPFLVVGSIGVAASRSIEELMAWRFLQTIGVSFGLSVGAAVIGDIYKLEERGTAMGIFFAACLIGPALAPVVGGFAAHYSSWRVMQAGLGVAGLIGLACVVLFLPETSFPGTRGIDRRRAELGTENVPFTIPNPFAAITLLRSPNIVAISLSGLAILLTDYVLLLPLPYTIAERYGITNQALIGLLYVPIGVGNLVGAPFAGWLSDQVLKKMLRKRGGVWCPEDRLRPTIMGAAVFVPLSVLGVGLITHYVSGPVGLILNMICFFFNGFGVDMVLSPCSAYIVDIMHSRSAESVAANNGLRSLLMAIGVSAIAPSINHVGILWTNIISALIAWAGFGLLWTVIQYGERMRNWVDVGYSTADTN